jgi:hypothetical protein
MRRPHVIRLSPVAFVLVALLAAGCGGEKSGNEAGTTAAETTTTGAETTTTASASTTASGPSEDAFANKELATISLRQLQECPASGSTQWNVLYHGKKAISQCGTGSAVVKGGGTTVKLQNGWCSINQSGDVSYYFGTIVNDPSLSGLDQPKLAYGPLRFDLSLGIAPHEGAKGDGTFVDSPVSDITKAKYGINAVLASNGKLWTNDGFEHTTTVTLTHQRTQGSITATTALGESMSGTFRCGDRIVGDAAP